MVALFKVAKWQVVASSRQGAIHKLKNVCNQDAVAYQLVRDGAVVAVADGHGSAASPYSDTGAQIAVRTACRHLAKFVWLYARAPFEVVYHRAAMLPSTIVHTWRKAVLSHAEKKGVDTAQKLHSVWLQFGCTLMAAALHSQWILLLQIGDGDILLVDSNGEVSRFSDNQSEHVGEATHSLCEPNAEIRVEWRLLPIIREKPLVLLCTDGYSKSFATQEDFLKAGNDWLRLLKDFDLTQVEEQMHSWLDETSRMGSGDDVTVAVAYWHSDTLREYWYRKLRLLQWILKWCRRERQ